MAAPILPQDRDQAPTNSLGPATTPAMKNGNSATQSRKILVLAGDHVGPEVMKEALKILSVLEDTRGIKFEATHELCGGCSIDKHDTPITDAVLQKAKECDAVLFGSAGGPEWYVCPNARWYSADILKGHKISQPRSRSPPPPSTHRRLCQHSSVYFLLAVAPGQVALEARDCRRDQFCHTTRKLRRCILRTQGGGRRLRIRCMGVQETGDREMRSCGCGIGAYYG